jgi:hypothetical protein
MFIYLQNSAINIYLYFIARFLIEASTKVSTSIKCLEVPPHA